MAFQENRLSSQLMSSNWIPPDERFRSQLEDYEAGPIAFEDTSEGLFNQVWHLTYSGGDLIATPETTGAPQTVLTVANVTQCSLAFDQNGHINVAYTAGGLPYLYWYDTALPGWTTDALDPATITPTLTLDDKRTTQTNASDLILFYTKETAPLVYTLYHRQQRDRFGVEYEHESGVPPYVSKLGMHDQLRVQIACSRAF